jgi:hypothetical protein
MKMRWIGLALALSVAACGGGGGGSSSTFGLMYEAPGGTGFAGGALNKLKFAAAQTKNLTLSDGITVTGTVTDGNGMPLANVDVAFGPAATSPSFDDDTTDGSGNYSVTIPAGTWMALLDSGSGTLGTLEMNGLSITDPGPVTFDFQFAAPVAVMGSVTEAFGPAIANAELRFRGQQTDADVTVNADGAGMYTANLVPDTYSAEVTPAGASATTHLEETFSSIVIVGGMTRNFALTAGVTVSGTVLNDVGLPFLDDVDIEIVLPANSPFSEPSDVTSDGNDGSYSIGPVPPGNITFRLEAPDDSGFPRQDITVQVVGPGVQMSDLMMRAGFVVSGTIYREGGVTPEDNVEVQPVPTNGSLEPDDDDTNGTGFYEVSVFAGYHDFELTPDINNLQLPETVRIQVTGDMVQDFTLTTGVLVTGTVTQPGGVLTEEDVRVEIQGVRDASDVSDGNGDYSFLAPAGTYTLTLTAENGSFEDMALAPVTGVVVAAPGPLTQDIQFALATTGRYVVSGIVYEPDGITPSVGTEIEARDGLGDVIGRTFSLAGGAYVLVIP